MTEQAFNIIFIVADVVRAMLICRFLICFTGARNKPVSYLLSVLLFMAIDMLAFYAGVGGIWGDLILFVLLTGFCLFLLKRTLIPSITGALVVVVLVAVLGNIFSAVLILASDALPVQMVSVINLICIGASVAALWMLLGYISARFSFAEHSGFPYMFTLWLPLIAVFVFAEVFSWATASNIIVVDANGFGQIQSKLDVPGWWGLFLFLFALICIVVLFWSYQKFKSFYAEREQALRLEQELRWQKTALEEATVRYDSTRAFRHDLKNHLNVLNGLISEGRDVEARKYLDKIGGFIQPFSTEIQSGNLVLDILLGEKLSVARQAGICVTGRFEIGKTAIDDYDLCILIGNALDNAIQACEKVHGDDTFIDIKIVRNKGFLCLQIINSTTGYCPKVQGYGLRNMRCVVEKYNGSMETLSNASVFEWTVLLSIPLQKEGVPLQFD